MTAVTVRKVDRGLDTCYLLQKPVLGVELPEEVEDPRSVKLVP